MKILVVGLGSMGKRRVRCLKTLGFEDIVGIDPRQDRREEAYKKYKIDTFDDISSIEPSEIYALIISTPPDIHLKYMDWAVKNAIPAFIEAGVIYEDSNEIYLKNRDKVFLAPSCTMNFHPLVRKIKEIVSSNEYGQITNFTYHSGQYLPDWHPWEDVKDFYVSNKVTGGAREIVPFELTWICSIVGIPEEIKGYYSATLDIGAEIEDTYAFNLRINKKITGSIIVDVASRFSTRSLILNFESGQLRWNWEEKVLRVYDANSQSWKTIEQNIGSAEDGYNENNIEEMYVDEISSFFEGIKDKSKYPNSLEEDIKILSLLKMLEESDKGYIKPERIQQ